MGNSTFSGPVRSEGGFTSVSKSTSTGAFTTQASISSAGFASLDANTLATEEVAKDTIKELRALSQKAFKSVPQTEEQMTSKSPLQQVEEIMLNRGVKTDDD